MPQLNHTDSDEHIFRKKYKGVNLLGTTTVELFKPSPGPKYVLLHAFLITHVVGTSTDEPNITLTTAGTGGGANVAAVDVGADPIPDGFLQRLTVTGNFIIDYDHPLTITIPDAGAGATTLTVDVIIVVLKVVD